MNKLSKNYLVVVISHICFSITYSKAWVMDVWTIEGMDAQELSDATAAYKEKAMAGGAKMVNIRSSSKLRGDKPGDTTFVQVYYNNFSDMIK